MVSNSDFGGNNPANRYCKFCTYPDGKDLKPRYEVRANMVKYYLKSKKMDVTDAEKYVDELMAGMPAWK
jgi:hypothetical protein